MPVSRVYLGNLVMVAGDDVGDGDVGDDDDVVYVLDLLIIYCLLGNSEDRLR